jgi:hypothetical protein
MKVKFENIEYEVKNLDEALLIIDFYCTEHGLEIASEQESAEYTEYLLFNKNFPQNLYFEWVTVY